MRILHVEDLKADVLESKYAGINVKIHLKTGKTLEGVIRGYTYDDEPFCDYVELDDRDVSFDEISEVNIL